MLSVHRRAETKIHLFHLQTSLSYYDSTDSNFLMKSSPSHLPSQALRSCSNPRKRKWLQLLSSDQQTKITITFSLCKANILPLSPSSTCCMLLEVKGSSKIRCFPPLLTQVCVCGDPSLDHPAGGSTTFSGAY